MESMTLLCNLTFDGKFKRSVAVSDRFSLVRSVFSGYSVKLSAQITSVRKVRLTMRICDSGHT